MTDDGYTLTDLEQSGFKLKSQKRQDLLNMTLRGFGINNKGGALEVETSPELFSLKKDNLIQAILSVNDLFYLASPIVKSLFLEDVISWLDLNQTRYFHNISLKG